MRKLHKKPLIMAAATLALTGTLAVGSAMAYFSILQPIRQPVAV